MKITDRTPQTETPRLARLASRLETAPSRFSQVLEDQNAAAATPASRTGAGASALPAAAAPSAAQTTNVFALVTAPQPAPAAPATTPAAPAPAVETPPTAESVFGQNPWMQSVGGYSNSGGSYSYNSMYFATRETAEKVAQMLGGKVVAQNAMVGDTGPFYQQQPNYMVQLPNGHLVNAGLTASYFTHGWSQSFIDTMLGYDRNV
jgi:hypothetical protein